MATALVKTRGYIAILGETIDRMAIQDIPVPKAETPYHVTFLTKGEVRQLDTSHEDLLKDTFRLEDPLDLGLGKSNNIYFNVLFWPQGNFLRNQLGLPAKQFHITLSSTDDHAIDKGVNSIIQPTTLIPEQIESIINDCFSAYKILTTRLSALEIINFLIKYHTSCMTDKSFDGVWRLLSRTGNESDVANLSSSYISSNPDSIAANLRSADCCDVEKNAKRAMHYYAYAAHLALKSISPSASIASIPSLCAKGIFRCSQYTEFGPFFQEDEIGLWEADPSFFCKTGEAFQNQQLLRLIQAEFANTMVSESVDMLLPELRSLPSNCRVFSTNKNTLFKLPRFFRWLLPFRLALISTPRTEEDISALAAHNITLVVTLTEEEPLPTKWFAGSSCRNVYIPVRNYRSPSIQQVNTFIELMDNLPLGEAALVHCGGGKGRAGVMAACYLMARGFDISQPHDSFQQVPHLFPADVMRLLRHLRPGSIETTEQEIFLKRYAKELVGGTQSKESTSYSIPALETQHPLQLSGSLSSHPSFIVCCGIPGSGKSTFSAFLAKHLGYAVISQDEMGSRAACLTALGNALQAGRHILIDRCSPYADDREEWLANAFHPHDALCVWFDVDRELCIRRADARSDHPTIAQGRARKIVLSFSKTFVQPTLREKFSCIARVPSNSASSELLIKLGVPESCLEESEDAIVALRSNTSGADTNQPPSAKPEKQFIYKFPRTRHLFNLGSATRDDLVLSNDDANAFLNRSDPSINITLEEKVDGANLGITLDPESSSNFKVQNRSHYVTSKSHAQFKKLDKWLTDQREGLENVFQTPPGRYILYGEWLYAKHSILYTSLPDTFLAFDLFDTETSTFLSRAELRHRLQNTGIHQVPEIPTPEKLDCETLLELVKTYPSKYYDGVLEGLYVRREKDGKTVDRSKIVRDDFLAGNEHWSRGIIMQNIISQEYSS